MFDYDQLKKNYDVRFTAQQVEELVAIGIMVDNTPLEKQSRLFPQINKLTGLKDYIQQKYSKEPHLTYFSGGNHAIILEDKSTPVKIGTDGSGYSKEFGATAWHVSPGFSHLYKISDDNENETKIRNKLLGEPENPYALINSHWKMFHLFIGNDIGNGILEIPTLENEMNLVDLVKDLYRYQDKEELALEVITTARDIFIGLLVLKHYGIYHRDLWLGNIVINQAGIASIIDFGLATDIPHSSPKNNRKYGGANDLISFGQILYKLYTGNNLFKSTIEESSWVQADIIKKFRTECYQSSAMLTERMKQLEQIDGGFQQKTLQTIIAISLQAVKPDPSNNSFAHEGYYRYLREIFNKHLFLDENQDRSSDSYIRAF